MLEVTVLAGYTGAAVLLIMAARRDDGERRGRAALALLAVSFGLHSLALWRAVLPAAAMVNLNLANTVALNGWMMAALAVIAAARPALRGIAALLALLAGGAALATGVGSPDPPGGNEPQWHFLAHALTATLAQTLVASAAALSLLAVAHDRRLRLGKPGGWTTILPPLETTERLMFGAITVGFALLTFGIFSGLFFVEDFFAQHLTHKTVLSLLAWAVLGVLLLGRWRFGWRGRTAMRWTVAGFAVLVLAYFGSRLVLELMLGLEWT